MLEPNAKYKKEDETMTPEQKKEFMNNMYSDVTFIWKNTLLAFIMSMFEHSKELLLVRIVDKCSIKNEKSKKRS